MRWTISDWLYRDKFCLVLMTYHLLLYFKKFQNCFIFFLFFLFLIFFWGGGANGHQCLYVQLSFCQLIMTIIFCMSPYCSNCCLYFSQRDCLRGSVWIRPLVTKRKIFHIQNSFVTTPHSVIFRGPLNNFAWIDTFSL